MARGSRSLQVEDFHLGLNTATPTRELELGEAQFAVNVIPDDKRGIKTRWGSTRSVSTTTAAINSISSLEPGAATGKAIFSQDDGQLKLLTGGFFPGTVTTLGTKTANKPWTFLRMPTIGSQGPYYGMNGTDAPQYVNASGVMAAWTATVGTLPNGKFMVYVENRLWVSGVASDPQAVFFSEVGDPTNFPAENVTRFGVSDGQPITALGTLGDQVLVFKADAIWRIYDTDTSANTKLDHNGGTANPGTVVEGSGGCFFLDRERGVCITNGQSVTRISDKILALTQLMAVSTNPNDISAVLFNGDYHLATRSSGSLASGTWPVARLFVYSTRLQSWWGHSFRASALAALDVGSGTILAIADAVGPFGMRLQYPALATSGDDGVQPTAVWQGGTLDFSNNFGKRLRDVQITGTGALTLDVQPSGGAPGGAGAAADLDWASGVDGNPGHLYSPGVAPAWVATISGAQAFSVDGLTFNYDLRKG